VDSPVEDHSEVERLERGQFASADGRVTHLAWKNVRLPLYREILRRIARLREMAMSPTGVTRQRRMKG